MDELNVKAVHYADPAGGHASVVFDTTITDELRLEWLAREVSRKVNELRKQARASCRGSDHAPGGRGR